MEKVSKRKQLIIKYLLENEKSVTSEELAKLAGITSRTIKTEIKELSRILEDSGAHLICTRGVGYQLECKDSGVRSMVRELVEYADQEHYEVPKTQPERISYIIKKLLMLDYYIKLDDLSEEMYISRSSLNLDMKEVRKHVKRFRLDITHLPGKGILLEGDEISKRKCICEYFFQHDSNDFMTNDDVMFSSIYNQKEIRFIKEMLVSVLHAYMINFSDLSIQNMVIHIFISLRRCRFYSYIQIEDAWKQKMADSSEFLAARKLKEQLEKQFLLSLPEDEIYYYAMHIRSKRILEGKYALRDTQLTRTVLQRIFDDIEAEYHLHFHDDQELNSFLSLHIPAMVERIQSRFEMRNSLLHDTIRHYPLAVSITLRAKTILEEAYQITIDHNEFAYLVLYFNLALTRHAPKTKKRLVLFCGRGRPETILMLNELNEKFGALIERVDVLDIQDLESSRFDEHDIIISTVPLPVLDCKETILVRTSIQDYSNEIYRALNSEKLPEVDFRGLVKPAYFDTGGEVHDKEEAYEQTALQMKTSGISDAYIELFQKTKNNCSELGNNCVLIHCHHRDTLPFLLCKVLKRPILWDWMNVQVILIANFDRSDELQLRSTYHTLSAWLDQPHYIRSLIQLQDYERFLETLETAASI